MKIILTSSLLLLPTLLLLGQPKVGINTSAPFRDLEVYGVSGQFMRVQSSSAFAGQAGIELVRGTSGQSHTDWRVVNDGGSLRFQYGQDNFNTLPTDAIRINNLGQTGIGTPFPSSTVHIDGGTGLAFGGLGYLKLGSHLGANLAIDNTQLQALDNGLAAPLYLQHNGGNTYFGNNGGHTYIGIGGGHLGVGTQLNEAPLTLHDSDFQFYLQNSSDDINGWYIGASNATWSAGDNQLVFSPTSSSTDAVLRLLDVTENDGIQSPVMLYNNYDHTLLLDGNEIDTRGTPLYINHNSDEETYLNPSGGRVGIGTTNPQAMVHVQVGSGDVLAIHRDGYRWDLTPFTGGYENLGFWINDAFNIPYAEIHGETGQWMALSDKTLKENIRPLSRVTEKVKELPLWNYEMIQDPRHRVQLGVIAQETAELFPEMVHMTDGQYGVSYAQLAVVGIKFVQEQQEMIDVLREKIQLIKNLAPVAGNASSK